MIGVCTPEATLSARYLLGRHASECNFQLNGRRHQGYLSAYLLPNAAAGSITITANYNWLLHGCLDLGS